MAELSSQKLEEYYDKYKTQELAFNKSIIQIMGVETYKICLKIKGDSWPCILYSCSMSSAKIIINLDEKGFEKIKLANNFASLRLSFNPPGTKSPVMFFVPVTVKDYRQFEVNNSKNTAFLMTLEFTSKPSDELIERLGRVFEHNENFEKRRALRIDVDEKIIGVIGLASTKAVIEMNGARRHCLLKNLSTSGALALIVCEPNKVLKQHIKLHLVESNTYKAIVIDGTIMRTETVVENNNIYGVGIMFDAEVVPYEYKAMLNNYIEKLAILKKRMEANPPQEK